MILIVESGSTKADWVFINADQTTFTFSTHGLNPTTHFSTGSIGEHKDLIEHLKSAEHIWFYGAGVVNETSKNQVKSWLKELGATGEIIAEGDLLGTARGISGDQESIIAILGTGSNACIYNGKEISYAKPSLGYIMGDEGSGVAIGKEVLKAYFYGTMPDGLVSSFESLFPITKDIVLDQVYQKNQGSAYIASFSTFLMEVHHDWKTNLLHKVFRDFIENRILPLYQVKALPVSFTGSIAYVYQEPLKHICSNYSIEINHIIQKPLEGLLDYHFKLRYQ